MKFVAYKFKIEFNRISFNISILKKLATFLFNFIFILWIKLPHRIENYHIRLFNADKLGFSQLGEEGSDTRELGGVQDFDELKFKYSSKNLFVDTEFPAFDFSIVPPEMRSRFSKEWLERHIGTCEWLRPKVRKIWRMCDAQTIDRSYQSISASPNRYI